MTLLKETLTAFFVIGVLAACMRIEPGTGAALTVIAGQGSGFGDVPVGMTVAMFFSIKNVGGFDASTVVIPSIPAPFALGSNSCSVNLPIGKSCELELRFTPTSVRSYDEKITITYQKGDGPGSLDIYLSGYSIESLNQK